MNRADNYQTTFCMRLTPEIEIGIVGIYIEVSITVFRKVDKKSIELSNLLPF